LLRSINLLPRQVTPFRMSLHGAGEIGALEPAIKRA
jgi:hypothetical protein